VQQIARGRVWTGAQAKDLGLVDDLGGFYQAVDKAKALAGLSGQTVRLKVVQAHKSPFDALGRALGVDSASLRALGAVAQVLADPRAQSALAGLHEADLRSRGALVLAPAPF
jgi:protease-4